MKTAKDQFPLKATIEMSNGMVLVFIVSRDESDTPQSELEFTGPSTGRGIDMTLTGKGDVFFEGEKRNIRKAEESARAIKEAQDGQEG